MSITQSRNKREGHYIGTGFMRRHYRDIFGGKRKQLYSRTSSITRKQLKADKYKKTEVFIVPF